MPYSLEERETILLTDDTLDVWEIYTRQGKIMTKLRKIGAEPYKTVLEEGKVIEAYYKIDYKQISFRKIIELSEEERQIRADQARRNLCSRTPKETDESEDEI